MATASRGIPQACNPLSALREHCCKRQCSRTISHASIFVSKSVTLDTRYGMHKGCCICSACHHLLFAQPGLTPPRAAVTLHPAGLPACSSLPPSHTSASVCSSTDISLSYTHSQATPASLHRRRPPGRSAPPIPASKPSTALVFFVQEKGYGGIGDLFLAGRSSRLCAPNQLLALNHHGHPTHHTQHHTRLSSEAALAVKGAQVGVSPALAAQPQLVLRVNGEALLRALPPLGRHLAEDVVLAALHTLGLLGGTPACVALGARLLLVQQGQRMVAVVKRI